MLVLINFFCSPLLMLWCMLRKVTEWRPLKGAQNRFIAWCWEPGIWTPQSAPPLKRPYKSYRTWDRRLFSVSLHVQCIYRYWQFLHLNNKCWNLKFNLLKFNYFFSKYDIYVIWHYKKYTFYKRYLEVVFNSFNLKKLQDNFHCKGLF